MSFTDLLNKTCKVKRKNETQNDYGEVISTWSDTNIYPCRLDVSNYSIVNDNYKTTSKKYTLFLDKSADITIADRVQVDGNIYDVNNVEVFDADVSSHHIEAELLIREHN